MADQTIRIVLTGDSSGLTSAANSGAQALGKFSQQAGGAAKGYKAIGDSAEFSAWQMRQVGPQITDIVTGLATGQRPFTVFLQQGGQLRDMFGGWGAASSALVQSLGATTVALGLGAAGVAALVSAWMQGAAQSSAFRNAVALTGNAAGITEGQFNALIERVSAATGATQSAVRDIAQAFVQSGRVSSPALEVITTAAARLAEVSGRSKEQVVGDLLSMANGVTDWARKNNEQYHFVTAAQLEHIRALEQQGEKQAAMVEAGQALIDHLASQREQLGLLERALKAVGGMYDSVKQSILSVGRTNTVQDQLASLRQELAQYQTATRDVEGQARGVRSYNPARVAELTRRIADLEIELADQNKRAAGRAEYAQQEDAATTRREKLLQVTEALAGANSEYTKTVNALAKSYAAGDKGVETYEKYQQLVLEARKKYNPAGDSRATSTGEGAAAKAEREYQQMVKSILANRAVSFREIEAKGYEAANRAAEQNMAQAAAEMRRRQQDVDQFGVQLVDQTAQINASLIVDDRQRGLAQIDLDRQSMQQRLDLYASYGVDVTVAQDALNANIVAKQAALNEQLKPGYQRLIDEWQRTTDVIAKTYDEGVTAMLQQSSQAFGQWSSGQTVSLKNLVKQWEATLAQGLFKTAVGNLLSSAGTNFFGELAGINFGVNAKGGVYQSASLHAYANSVVSSPTVFAFAKGIGLMGEAGPEAIMPLKRTPSGSLGVVATGGMGGNSLSVSMPLSVQIDARSDQAQVAELVRQAVAQGNTALLKYLKDKGWI